MSAESIGMRVFWTSVITIAIMSPSVPLFVRSELTADAFGMRFILAVLFAVMVTGIAATFAKAAAAPEPAAQPQRRKTDQPEPVPAPGGDTE